MNTLSNLGSPLEFSVVVSADPQENLTPECVVADVYSGDNRLPPDSVRVRIDRSSTGAPTSLRISTSARMDEPVATVNLMLGCPTRLTRKYVVFIDPPMINLAQSGAPMPLPQAGSSSSPLPTADLGASPASPARRTPRSAAQPPADDSPRRSASSGARPPSSSAAERRAAAAASTPPRPRRTETARAASPADGAASRSGGPRLKLESAPALSASGPARGSSTDRVAAGPAGAAAVGALASGAASGVADSGNRAVVPGATAASGPAGLLAELSAKAGVDALTLDQERLRELEERFNRLRTDNDNTKKALAALEARLQEAEAARYANPLVYGLIAAVLLLLLVLVALLLRKRQPEPEGWLKAAEADSGNDNPDGDPKSGLGAAGVASVVHPTGPGKPVLPRRKDRKGKAAAAAAVAAETAAAEEEARNLPEPTDIPTQPVADGMGAAPGDALAPLKLVEPQPVVARGADVRGEGRRDVSVEELIDLEQQADFFMVLGQEEAAIDLLMGHVQGTGGASPMPYLKLLDIHRRRGDHEEYERVRERFNRRFNAFAPQWDAAGGEGRTLEAYPEVASQLQAAWPNPAQAMDLLESLLFQRDPATATTFDLPAYGELLFLYSQARDLAEHEVSTDDVDLLLPIQDDDATMIGKLSPMSLNPPSTAPDTFSLDLDLGLEPLPEEKPRRNPPSSDDPLELVPPTSPVPFNKQ